MWTDQRKTLDPGGTSISGGSLGSIDHLLTGLVAEKVGIDPAQTNYIAYSGGGEALTSMLSGTTVAGMSGRNEVADQIEAGNLRALAVSSEERLPGVDVPTFLAYGTEKRLTKRRGDTEFGSTGSIKGVAAPEAAGNATAGTAMGALLALGLPTSATAAIMLAAFQQYGMQPGPLLFERSGELVWTLLASLFIGLVVLVILNMQFAVLWAKLLLIPRHYLYAGITVLSMLGVYAISSATLDLWVLLAIGLLGFVMRRYQFPLAPVLIAVVLGPLAETELRRALTVAEGDASILVSSPVTIILYSVLVLALAVSGLQHLRHRRQKAADAAGGTGSPGGAGGSGGGPGQGPDAGPVTGPGTGPEATADATADGPTAVSAGVGTGPDGTAGERGR